jgi:hypothetical protein
MFPELRAIVRGAYDLQKVRIQLGNRIVANFKVKLGQAPSHGEESLDQESKDILALLRAGPAKITDALVDHHKRTETGIELEEDPEDAPEDAPSAAQEKKMGKLITELVAHRYSAVIKDEEGKKSFPKKDKFKGDPVISNYTELVLFGTYMDTLKSEKNHFERLKSVLMDYTVYTDYLAQITGIGPAMAGVLLSELDIRDKPAWNHDKMEILKDEAGQVIMKPLRPSSFVKYAGLDCGSDGKGRSKRPEHLVERKYKDHEGNIKTKKGITFNDFLKTKLIGVLGPCMLRSANEKYGKIYRDYKHRLENHAIYGTRNDGRKELDQAGAETKKYITCKARRHAMATRYMVSFFLRDLYTAWRKIEGLPVALPYAEAKLGLKHRPD